MSVHPKVLCPVPEGECDEHLPPAGGRRDDGLRRAIEEAIAEPGTNRSALLLGALLSACDYVVTHDLMTTGEVASMFRVTEATVTAWVREGKLSALTTPGGKGYRFHRATVEAFLAPAEPTGAA